MNHDQLQFIADNTQHFEMVIEHDQQFQQSHDITKQVLAIGQQITGAPFDECGCSIKEIYTKVWDQYVIATAS